MDKLIEYGETINAINKEDIIKDIIKECDKGLLNDNFIDSNNNVSSLPMFLTYIDPNKLNNKLCNNFNKDIICMDLGGTNYRVSLVTFELGLPKLKKVSAFKTPGIDKELTKTEYFTIVVSALKDFIDSSNEIRLCFSYGLKMNEKLDGMLLKWSKEVKASEVVGSYIGQSIKEKIKEIYNKDINIKILNDTSATLLSSFILNEFKPNFTYLGLIYGTGLNICYVEKAKKIKKLDSNYKSDYMVINTEIANYKGFNLGKYDKLLIDQTIDKSLGLTEKICSGGYLPKLIYIVCSDLIKSFGEKIDKESCTLIEVSKCLNNEGSIFDNLLEEEKKSFIEISNTLIDRASLIVSLLTSSLLIKMNNKNAIISVEGTTFYKLFGFKERYIKYLDEILSKYNINYELLDGRDKNLLSCAIL